MVSFLQSEQLCVKNDKFRWDIDKIMSRWVEASAMKNFPSKRGGRQWERFTADFPPPLSTHLALPLAACMFWTVLIEAQRTELQTHSAAPAAASRVSTWIPIPSRTCTRFAMVEFQMEQSLHTFLNFYVLQMNLRHFSNQKKLPPKRLNWNRSIGRITRTFKSHPRRPELQGLR